MNAINYIKELTARVQEITNVVSKPYGDATVEDVLKMIDFYDKYSDINALIDNAEKYIREDVESPISDIDALQIAIYKYFESDRDAWIVSGSQDIIDRYLADIYEHHILLENEYKGLEQTCPNILSRMSLADFETIKERQYKLSLESKELYNSWLIEKNKFSEIKYFKFIHIEAIIIRIDEGLKVIKIEVNEISPTQSGFIPQLLTIKDKVLTRAAKTDDFVPPRLCCDLYEICKSNNVFKNKMAVSDFVSFFNFRKTHVKIELGDRKKSHICLIVWWIGEVVLDPQIHIKWKNAFYNQIGIDNSDRYENRHVKDIREVPSKTMREFVVSINKLFVNYSPERSRDIQYASCL